MTEEHVIISVTREDLEDYLFRCLDAELEGDLTDEDIEAIAYKLGDLLGDHPAVGDCYYNAMYEVLGERLKEDDEL